MMCMIHSQNERRSRLCVRTFDLPLLSSLFSIVQLQLPRILTCSLGRSFFQRFPRGWWCSAQHVGACDMQALSLTDNLELDFSARFSQETKRLLRVTIIDLVLATDMSRHFDIVTLVKSKVRMCFKRLFAGSQITHVVIVCTFPRMPGSYFSSFVQPSLVRPQLSNRVATAAGSCRTKT